MQKITERSAIPDRYKWDPYSIFPSQAAWEAAIDETDAMIATAAQFRGRLREGPHVINEFLGLSEAILRNVGQITVFATMFYAVDTNDREASAMRDRAIGLQARASAALAFGEPELLAIGGEQLLAWAERDEHLATYTHYFERLIARAAHIRSAEIEELLGQVRDPFAAASAIHGVLANAELHFPPARDSQGVAHEITQGTINALITHPDRTLRKNAWEGYADAHIAVENTMAQCLAAGVKQNVFIARARRYASALEAALKPNFIPLEVFHNLIATFERHLPVWHRYWRVRRAALGIDELHVYDTKAPLATPLVVPYEQAIEWICEGMAPLGAEYVQIMRRGLQEQRWVDVYPNRGKRAGAFSTGAPGTHPFIMMSYNDDIFSLSTLAHELGHSMHSYYTRRTQPVIYTNYGLFLAEVASNFNQALVRDYLFKTLSDRNAQIAIIEEAMANFHRYFFVMPTLARFELIIHQRAERGQPLTAAIFNELMADLFAEGYGSEVVVDRGRVGNTWAQFSTHLYSNFYVYQYATGIAGAHALAAPILAGEAGAAERYINEFLKAGGSRFPLEVLRRAGVDLASPEPIERTFAIMASYIDRLEALVKAEE
ncbi:oligoendopeptidase F [Chloroflexus sp. MS-G]|jgi:oligoendopeptidase F|uniref:oligoendopeptidase F n=1 Tax=Chloroflexus sp. MS-G TaxID=1521187 RepID=UPI0004DFAB49|nr:oligoendopeptidase F [Chloroflexus sp. MS-G]